MCIYMHCIYIYVCIYVYIFLFMCVQTYISDAVSSTYKLLFECHMYIHSKAECSQLEHIFKRQIVTLIERVRAFLMLTLALSF